MRYAAVRRRGLILLLAGLAVVWFSGRSIRQQPPVTAWPSVTLTPQDRLLVLAPHPDDEVLCCGGLIQDAVARGLPLRVVVFTYGDNNQWAFTVYRKHPVLMPHALEAMGAVRHDEALAAAAALGVSPGQLTFLGYPDFGTLQIWNAHWGDRPPFRSMLTRVTAVPYATALRPGAAYTGENVLQDLTAVLEEFKPTKVFVSHPGDHMPDHRALYLFTRVALWDAEAHHLRPELYPYLVHYGRWPQPRAYQPADPLEPPEAFRREILWGTHALTPAQVERKLTAIQAHRTQYAYSEKYLLSFIRPNELFGDFPAVWLRRGVAGVPLGRGAAEANAPEELTDVERAAFVGLETRSAELEGDTLVLKLGFSRPLGEAVEASIYAFGYRADRPFGQMPKLHVKVNALHTAVYDQERLLVDSAIRTTRHPKQFTVSIPLAALGQPQRILTSARTYLEDLPLDWASWRVLKVPPTQERGHGT